MSSLVDSATGPAVLARGGSSGPAIANAPAAATKLPAELHHRFRFIAIDGSLLAEAEGGAAALLDALLAMGVRVAIFAGGSVPHLAWRLARGVRAENRRRLFLGALDGAELHGHDRHGAA